MFRWAVTRIIIWSVAIKLYFMDKRLSWGEWCIYVLQKTYVKLFFFNQQADPDAVIELTDSNFHEKVIQSEDIWLVEFFAPWCGHCKNLAPQWAQAATELKGKVKLGALDATVHTVMASRYGVSTMIFTDSWLGP